MLIDHCRSSYQSIKGLQDGPELFVKYPRPRAVGEDYVDRYGQPTCEKRYNQCHSLF
jgi:hypothetical protein